MTWQTNTAQAADEAFWDLVWSDPDLFAADLHDLAEHTLPPPPSDRTPPEDRPAEAPHPPGRAAPEASPPRPRRAHRTSAAASGKVRSPPATGDRARRPA